MTPETLITAVMPVAHYDSRFLGHAIASLMEQTSPRWRLLVVDDGATDLAQALKRYDDPRICVVANDGSGFGAAVNTGIQRATTEFVGLLFADDLWSPDAVEVLSARIEGAPDVDFFHSSRRFIDADGRVLSGTYSPEASFELDDFISKSAVKHLLCFRRAPALAIGGVDESLPPVGLDDWDFPWTMAERGARFMAVPECLYQIRDHREYFRLTTHLPRTTHIRALRTMLRKHRVGRRRIRREVAKAKRGYLRQCLYRSPFDRWVKQRRHRSPRDGWRETYRH